MRVAHRAQAVLVARLVNHRMFTRRAKAGGWNFEDALAGKFDEPVPFNDNCRKIWVSSWLLVSIESGCNSG